MTSNCESMGICQRLFNFLIDIFLAGGLKRITLGRTTDHGSAIGAPQTGAVSAGCNTEEKVGCSSANTVGNAEEKNLHSPDIEGIQKVKIEFLQANGLAMKGGSQVQEEGFDVGSTWTFELGKSGDIGSDNNEQQKSAENDSQAVNSGDKSEVRGLTRKKVTIEDAALERDMQKKKEKNKAIILEETLAPAIVPEKEVKMEAPDHAVPLIWSAFDIDQRSDELIRRTREALRSSSGTGAGSF